MNGRHRVPECKLAPTTQPLAPPQHLTEEAKKLYRRLVKELAPVLTSLDTTTLAIYCQSWSRWVEAEKILSVEGLVDNKGRIHPMQRISDTLTRQMKALASELGLSPLARGRIAGPSNDGSDELEAFLR